MISSVVVSYQVRPEAVAEHVRLIEAVFEQLHAEQPGNVEYKVVRLDDGCPSCTFRRRTRQMGRTLFLNWRRSKSSVATQPPVSPPPLCPRLPTLSGLLPPDTGDGPLNSSQWYNDRSHPRWHEQHRIQPRCRSWHQRASPRKRRQAAASASVPHLLRSAA